MNARTTSAAGWMLLAAIGLAQSMLVIDLTVVNLALPSIGRELGLDRQALTWTVTAYTLAFGSGLLLGGRLADRYGRRRLFLAGLLTFTTASLVAGQAPNGTLLIAARAVQGVGAAMLSPAALSIITTSFHGPDRSRALGVWAALGGVGAVVGVALGGLLTAGPGWRWVFLINVPVGIGAALAVTRLVPADGRGTDRAPLGAAGAGLAAAFMIALLFALIRAPEAGWSSAPTLLALSIAAGALLLFGLAERWSAAPLIPRAVLVAPGVAGGLAGMLGATALLGGIAFAASLYAQQVLDLGALETAAAFIPFALALVAGAQAAAHSLTRVPPATVRASAFGAAALGAALLGGQLAGEASTLSMIPGLVVFAAGVGAGLVTASIGALSRVEGRHAGLASGLVNASHELGMALGVAVVSAALAGSVEAGTSEGFALAHRLVAAGAAAMALLSVLLAGHRRVAGERVASVQADHFATERVVAAPEEADAKP